MIVVLLILNLILSAVVSVVLALFEALVFGWLWPDTGITGYDPTYWQAFALCLLVNIIVGFSTSAGNSTSSK
jgi:hypothetical protein